VKRESKRPNRGINSKYDSGTYLGLSNMSSAGNLLVAGTAQNPSYTVINSKDQSKVPHTKPFSLEPTVQIN